MADNVTATGKYFLISVREFASDPVGPRAGQKMTSFLRLGAFHESPESEEATARALQLAQLAQVVSTSQGGHLTAPYGAEVDTSVTGVEGKGVFLDDQRNDDPEQISQAERLKQSAALLTRGGWWDHSDGNRVSTTYGDKVEVIRGNYKMVVMHRQDDATGGGGWDLSGGHVQDLGPNSMPGASVRVEFRPGMFGQRGTWHLENTTNNFIQTSDYAGDFFEHWYGNLKQCTVGSESPKEWNDDLSKPYGNPQILEKTWASKIESYTGSAAWRIPSITEETYAKTTSSTTDVSGNIDESTYCDGTMTSKTGKSGRLVPMIHEETWAAATVSITNVAGAVVETTNMTTQVATTLAGASVEVDIIGAKEEVAVHAHHGAVEVALHSDEIFLGTKVGIELGAFFSMRLGPAAEFEYPEKKEIKLDDVKASLNTMRTAVRDAFTGIDWEAVALSMSMMAPMVRLGM